MAEDEIKTKVDRWFFDRVTEIIEKGNEPQVEELVDEFLLYIADAGGDPRKYPRDALLRRAGRIIELVKNRLKRRLEIEEIRKEQLYGVRLTNRQYNFLKQVGWSDKKIGILLETIERGIASVDKEGNVTDKTAIDYARATLGTLKKERYKPQSQADIDWLKRMRFLARQELDLRKVGITEPIKITKSPLRGLKAAEAELSKEAKEAPPWRKKEYWPGLLRKPPIPAVEGEKKEGEEKKEEKKEGKPPREEKEFEALPLQEREKARKEWYKNQKKDIREKYLHEKALYKAGKISRAEFRNRVRGLKREKAEKRREAYGPLGAKRAARFLGRGLQTTGGFTKSRYGEYILKIVWVLALVVVGAVVAGTTGSWYFFIGFLALAIYFLVPNYENIEPEGGPLSWDDINVFGKAFWKSSRRRTHGGWAWIKSIAKVTAIIFFALAFRNLGDVFNIAFIATVFLGYFSMKIEFDPKYPGEFIESMLRFGVLGAYFIPFWIFGSIFQSYVLVAIAFAFFAIPPMPSADIKNLPEVLSRSLSGMTGYYEMFDKTLFAVLMVFALMGALLDFPGWGLTGALQKTFIYFWIVAGIGGFFSPVRERPLTGLLMLGGATIIYGIGPGSQEVGTALLGEWWPYVHNGVTDVFEPVVGVFDQLGQTFSNAFLLITNPVGYATSILNGTYAQNPSGKTGAFGVEVNDFFVSPVFKEQPFLVTVTIKNEGSFAAKGVEVELKVSEENAPLRTPPGAGSAPLPGFGLGEADTPYFSVQKLTIDKLGFTKTFERIDKETGSNPDAQLTQQDTRVLVFQSNGITCPVINEYSLRKKFIPLLAQVNYDYAVESNLEMEFLEEAEWERRIQEKILFTRQKLSTISTAPVKLNIGTLDQPIREGVPFHVGMTMISQEGKNSRINDALVELDFPRELRIKVKPSDSNQIQILPDCTSADKIISWEPPKTENGRAVNGKIVWKFGKTEEIGSIICQFDALKDFGEASKTFLVSANASYSFSRWKTEDTRIEFTGECPPTSGTTTPSYPVFGASDYCAKIDDYRPTAPLCQHGEGGCADFPDNCDKNAERPIVGGVTYGPLDCRSVQGVPVKVCCFEGQPDEDCRKQYYWNLEQAKKITPPAVPAVPVPAPPEYVPPPISVCGNGVCEVGETNVNCPQDCPVAPAAMALYVPDQYRQFVLDASAKHNVEPALIAAMIVRESNWNPNAIRNEPQINDASYGLMQILCGTANDLGFAGSCDGLYNPSTNIDLGTKYVRQQLDRFGSTELAVAAYNCGPGNIQKAVNKYGYGWEKIGPHIDEFCADGVTSAYVPDVISLYTQFKQQDGQA